MTRVKIDTSATIDGATTDGATIAEATPTIAATTVIVDTTVTVDTTVVDTTVIHTQCRETMLAALVDGRGIYAASTIKTGTQATLQPPPTYYRDCAEQSEPAAAQATATTAGTATTNFPT